MKKKRKKESAFLLSFLDILSNTLAAVFILTMVSMEPAPSGVSSGGLYYIQVNRDNEAVDSAIVIGTKFDNNSEYLHEPKEYLEGDVRLLVTERSAKLLFLTDPDLSKVEDMFCYLADPDFSVSGECVTVMIKTPDSDVIKNIWLDADNEYRSHFFKDGKLNGQAFSDCNDIITKPSVQ